MKTVEELIKEHGLNYNQALVVASNHKELIVPAGAGSGKTKTLVTKVLELLKMGNSLDNFLVLTFTKKAASEMKERIKKMLVQSDMIEMANKIDSSNISTFDAFAYNFVKQNASIIGLDSNIELLDQSIFNTIKNDLMEDIIIDIMADKDNANYDFIKNYSSKMDEEKLIKSLLYTYNNLVELGPLSSLYLSKLTLNKNLFNYDNLINEISDLSEEFIEMYQEYLQQIKNYFNYLNGHIKEIPEFILPRFAWAKLELSDSVKKQLQKTIKETNDLLKISPTLEQLNTLFEIETKDIISIIDLLKIYEIKLTKFKERTNKYEFSDISGFLNKILSENEDILQRQKDKFIYVFVDEYQDTSKVQADFLEMLINGNEKIKVLYVGDLKQSIYKFRNAKPDTFIQKQKDVEVISLDTNYRSSTKVINFVNDVFVNIMDDEVKYDLNYKNGHIMESGNASFNDDISADVHLIEMFKEEKSRIKNDAVEEAFIIGNKINELLKLGKINKYSDVAILSRNKGSFNIYLDVFKYLNIPIQIQVDQNLKQTYLLKLISNILRLSNIINEQDKYLFNEKRFLYFSIARSELFEKSDYELFSSLLNQSDTSKKSLEMSKEIIDKLYLINKAIKTKSNFEILDLIVKEFNIHENIIKTKKIEEKLYQLDYLYQLSMTLSDLGINSIDFVNYIYNLSYNDDINLSISILDDNEENSVKVTNIHQSKGLEYNTLFVSGLNRDFNRGTVDLFDFNNTSLFNVNIKNSTKDSGVLALNEYIRNYRSSLVVADNLKEELRLLYVALTRAEKALYLITVPKEDYIELNSFTDYLYMNDFKHYIKKDNIETMTTYVKSSDYYLKIQNNDWYYDDSIDKLRSVELFIDKKIQEKSKASKQIITLITSSEFDNINKGIALHGDFEFNNLDNKLVKNLYEKSFNNKKIDEGEVITEYQFSYNDSNKNITGIIDMIVIHDDQIHIIDYKLRNLDDKAYANQMNTYRKYISTIFNLPIKLYLYSITTSEVKEIELQL